MWREELYKSQAVELDVADITWRDLAIGATRLTESAGSLRRQLSAVLRGIMWFQACHMIMV